MVIVSHAFGTFPARGTIAIDRAGIIGIGTIITTEIIQIQNQGGDTLYYQIEINDSSANWTFDDDTTIRNLGSVGAGGSVTFSPKLKRQEPSGDVEETFNIIIRAFLDSGYTNKIWEYTWPIDVYIVDFKDSPNWIVAQEWNWDDGTPQGWEIEFANNGGVTDIVSIVAGGYSWYQNKFSGIASSKYAGLSLPSGSQVLLVGYLAYKGSKSDSYVKDFEVLFAGNTVLLLPGYLAGNNGALTTSQSLTGWWQFVVDLTDYKGQTGDLQIRNGSYYATLYFDNLMIVYKP